MAFKQLTCGLLALAMTAATAAAQEKGLWRAANKTAQSVTGDIGFSETKFSLNFTSYTIAQIREFTPAEISAAFDGATGGSGNLFRVSIPFDKKFLHKNSICNGEETQWIATYVSGKSLQIEFFSGASMPEFTPEAFAKMTNLCGVYMYAR